MNWEAVLEKVIAGLVIASILGILGGFFQVWRNHDAIEVLKGQVGNIEDYVDPPKAEPPQAPARTSESTPEPRLDAAAEPRYGEVVLDPGFLPDPHVQRGVGGGAVDVSYLPGGDCIGYAREAPYLRLDWVERDRESDELRVFFAADEAEDASLLVNLPSGSWVCNDDSSPTSLDPLVVIKNPEVGLYNIWVGSYLPGPAIPGTLGITELDGEPRSLLPFGSR